MKKIKDMKKDEFLSVNEHTKIIVPATSYDIKDDSRLLIPFTSGEKIGFISKEGRIVVEPKFSMYYGDCYDSGDFIRVLINSSYGFARKSGKVSAYMRPLYGLINAKGDMIFSLTNHYITPAIGNRNLFTIRNKDDLYGVFNTDGNEIVPFGKYKYISGFDNGLAIVTTTAENSQKKGLIDENGVEVLPTIYDDIWNFYGKGRITTKVIKDNISKDINLSKILNEGKRNKNHGRSDDDWLDDYGSHYGEYSGTYAQDVAGLSDDVINDAFEGDPDAYWNID